MTKKWVYDMTIHSALELTAPLLEEAPQRANEEPQVISCDTEGHCFFEEVLKPSASPFLTLLNHRGAEGWELMQHNFHSGNVYLLWKKEVDG